MAYEVDNLVQMGDLENHEHDGPVFATKDDADWYLQVEQSEDMTAWVREVTG